MTWKVFGHRRHPAAAALVHALDVGAAHLPHPPWIAAKGPCANVTLATGPGIAQYVHAGAKQQVHAHGRQFEARGLAHGAGVVQIPRCAYRHSIGQGGGTTGDTGVGIAVALVIHGDKQRNLDAALHGQRLETVGQFSYLVWGVGDVVEIGVGGQQDDATELILLDEPGDVGARAGIISHKGHQEKLAYALFHAHRGQNRHDLGFRIWLLGMQDGQGRHQGQQEQDANQPSRQWPDRTKGMASCSTSGSILLGRRSVAHDSIYDTAKWSKGQG